MSSGDHMTRLRTFSPSTRLAGHGLRAEGKPFEDDGRGSTRRADVYGEPDGFGLCSCGERSGVFGSDADRKRWHKTHKEQVRQEATPAVAAQEEN